jgi:hypothetical protein
MSEEETKLVGGDVLIPTETQPDYTEKTAHMVLKMGDAVSKLPVRETVSKMTRWVSEGPVVLQVS